MLGGADAVGYNDNVIAIHRWIIVKKVTLRIFRDANDFVSVSDGVFLLCHVHGSLQPPAKFLVDEIMNGRKLSMPWITRYSEIAGMKYVACLAVNRQVPPDRQWKAAISLAVVRHEIELTSDEIPCCEPPFNIAWGNVTDLLAVLDELGPETANATCPLKLEDDIVEKDFHFRDASAASGIRASKLPSLQSSISRPTTPSFDVSANWLKPVRPLVAHLQCDVALD